MVSRSALLLAAAAGATVHALTCYNPDGSLGGRNGGGLIACNSSAEQSACCSPGDMCTSQGFCKNAGDGGEAYYWRGSCTDQSWQSRSCPKYCYNTTTDSRAASNNWLMFACSQTTFCCTVGSSNNNCCSDESRIFDAGPASYGGGAYVATQQYPITMASSTTLSTVHTTVATTNPSATAPPLPSNKARRSGTGLSTGAKAGIGVGAALGALALFGLGVLAAVLARRQKTRRHEDMAFPAAKERKAVEADPQELGAGPEEAASKGQKPVEVDSRAVRAELMADYHD